MSGPANSNHSPPRRQTQRPTLSLSSQTACDRHTKSDPHFGLNVEFCLIMGETGIPSPQGRWQVSAMMRGEYARRRVRARAEQSSRSLARRYAALALPISSTDP